MGLKEVMEVVFQGCDEVVAVVVIVCLIADVDVVVLKVGVVVGTVDLDVVVICIVVGEVVV